MKRCLLVTALVFLDLHHDYMNVNQLSPCSWSQKLLEAIEILHELS